MSSCCWYLVVRNDATSCGLSSVDLQGHSHGGHSHGDHDHASHTLNGAHDNDHSAESQSHSHSSPAVVELSDRSQSHAGHAHARAMNGSRRKSRFSDVNMLGVLVHILGDALNSVAVSECKLLAKVGVKSSSSSS